MSIVFWVVDANGQPPKVFDTDGAAITYANKLRAKWFSGVVVWQLR